MDKQANFNTVIFFRICLQGLMIVLLFSISVFNTVHAQGAPSSDSDSEASSDSSFKFLPIPYINYDRSIGFSIGAIPMAMYKLNKKDTISPSSLSGLVGMYSTNKTWFTMAFSKFYMAEDTWRIVIAGGLGNINYQFFAPEPIGRYISYATEAKFVYLKAQRKILPKFYGGLSFMYADYETEFADAEDLTTFNILRSVGAVFSYDNRSNVYYPRKGFEANITFQSYPEFMGNDFISNNIEVYYNHFYPSRGNKDVVATRVFAGFGMGDISFNQQMVVGQTDIRGYSEGKYRGDQLIAIQAEYRWNPYDRIGFVGFAGVASVFNAIDESHDGLLLPGIGAGFRYTAFVENKMNIGIDLAVGKGDWGFYFKIGEAF